MVVANLHGMSITESMIALVKQYTENLLESVTEAGDKWYEHEPESVSENEEYKILRDFSTRTDHVIEARRPDLVVAGKKRRICKTIDFAVPGDSRVEEKEKEKIRSKKRVIEDSKCESEDYTISCGHFRSYT